MLLRENSVNIQLLKVNETYLELIMNWRMSSDITRYMNTDPVLTIESQKKWFSSFQKDLSKKI